MDHELALINVMKVVFSSIFHLLCVFHIAKNVNSKCKEYIEANRKEHIMDLWNKVMHSNNVFEFENYLHHFEVVCADIPSFVKHVHQTCLTHYK